jgi:hypothetical protein
MYARYKDNQPIIKYKNYANITLTNYEEIPKLENTTFLTILNSKIKKCNTSTTEQLFCDSVETDHLDIIVNTRITLWHSSINNFNISNTLRILKLYDHKGDLCDLSSTNLIKIIIDISNIKKLPKLPNSLTYLKVINSDLIEFPKLPVFLKKCYMYSNKITYIRPHKLKKYNFSDNPLNHEPKNTRLIPKLFDIIYSSKTLLYDNMSDIELKWFDNFDINRICDVCDIYQVNTYKLISHSHALLTDFTGFEIVAYKTKICANCLVKIRNRK